MVAIRGAISAENTAESITENTEKLLIELLERNKITQDDVVSLVFSLTRDLTAFNPATVARTRCGFTDTALFCVQEAEIDGAPQSVVRVLAFVEGLTKKDIVNVYLGRAADLRNQFDGLNRQLFDKQ